MLANECLALHAGILTKQQKQKIDGRVDAGAELLNSMNHEVPTLDCLIREAITSDKDAAQNAFILNKSQPRIKFDEATL